MSIEEIEWLEVVDEYARSIAANIPGDGAQLAVKHLMRWPKTADTWQPLPILP